MGHGAELHILLQKRHYKVEQMGDDLSAWVFAGLIASFPAATCF